MALPATDAIRPLTCTSPLAGADDAVVDPPVALAVDVGLDLFDEPHAAMDSAMAPLTARIARPVRQLADINVSPIVGWGQRMGVPAEAVGNLCNWVRQNASSETRMISSSMDSMTPRRAVSLGSMSLAKNPAVTTLP